VLLATHFVQKYARLLGKDLRGIDPSVRRLFEAYPWPGNVRELENAVEYAANLERTPVIQVSSLPERIKNSRLAPAIAEARPLRIADMERRMIVEALEHHGLTQRGKRAAAAELGIGIATLYRKISRYNIDLAR
jgi:transcriptional regulator with PAS, ATPase and Fis domain